MCKSFQLIILLLFSVVNYSYGQHNPKEGYIITTQSDTLRGKIKFKSDTLLLLDNKSKNLAKEAFTPDQVKAAFTGEKYYSVENVLGRNKFLQEVLTGYLSLYQFQSTLKGENFFLKRNDTVYVVTENSYLGLMSFFLRECQMKNSLTAKKVKYQYKHSLKGMTQFVSYYNSCKGFEEEQVVRYKPKKFSFEPVMRLGLDAHKFEFGDNNRKNPGAAFGNNLGFVAGVSVKIWGKDEGFSVHPGLQFTHKEGSATELAVPVNIFSSVDIDFSANFLEMPLLLRYFFTGKGIRPYVSLGPHVGGSFMSSIKRTPHGFTYREDSIERVGEMGVKYGVTGNAGVYFPNILKGMEVEFRADKSYYGNDYDMADLQSSSLQFLIGFYLK